MPIATEWTEAMSVGVAALDDDHRILLGVLNQLGQAIADGEAVDVVASVVIFFCDHVRTHFRREERLLALLDYPAMDAHRAEHRDFVRWSEEFRRIYANPPDSGVPPQMIAFPAGWWIRHILIEDRDYRDFLAERPQAVADALAAEDLFDIYGFSADDEMTADDLLTHVEDAAAGA